MESHSEIRCVRLLSKKQFSRNLSSYFLAVVAFHALLLRIISFYPEWELNNKFSHQETYLITKITSRNDFILSRTLQHQQRPYIIVLFLFLEDNQSYWNYIIGVFIFLLVMIVSQFQHKFKVLNFSFRSASLPFTIDALSTKL